jgi:hypothetical protein
MTISAIDIIEVAGVAQNLNHVACPSLALLLQQVGQLAQVMGVAQSMLAQQCFVRHPAVMHQDALELLEQSLRIERLGTPFGVAAHPDERVCGQHMQPVQLRCNP